MKNKIILTSFGLSTSIGRKLIGKELANDDLENKRIFLFHEPYYSIEPFLVDACEHLGFSKHNIILSRQQKSNEEVLACDYLYCTEGNTFEILSLLRERNLDKTFVEAFNSGSKVYIGASAGAMIAGVSIEEALSFDRNTTNTTDFTGLCLFDGIVLPHYNQTELKRYIKNSPGIETKYKQIFSVANNRSLVLEV